MRWMVLSKIHHLWFDTEVLKGDGKAELITPQAPIRKVARQSYYGTQALPFVGKFLRKRTLDNHHSAIKKWQRILRRCSHWISIIRKIYPANRIYPLPYLDIILKRRGIG
ncbi:hypothetical protein A9K66_13020 [Mesorhizobium sp. AA23]|nr:hypothetical protein A9K66_13020 [Mesorhizobium sp. AA23]